jgi:hypothetical protein
MLGGKNRPAHYMPDAFTTLITFPGMSTVSGASLFTL